MMILEDEETTVIFRFRKMNIFGEADPACRNKNGGTSRSFVETIYTCCILTDDALISRKQSSFSHIGLNFSFLRNGYQYSPSIIVQIQIALVVRERNTGRTPEILYWNIKTVAINR